jgi:hypothetical protein
MANTKEITEFTVKLGFGGCSNGKIMERERYSLDIQVATNNFWGPILTICLLY